MKAVQGSSLLPTDVLSEMLNETREKLLVTNRRITELNEELENGNARMEKLRAEYSTSCHSRKSSTKTGVKHRK